MVTTAQGCRFCGGETALKFKKLVLEKYDVEYQECSNCKSLQTERPFWIKEAYSGNHLTLFDTGAAQRNINNLINVYTIAQIYHCRNLVDIGGGDGLLCRMLRDRNLNCYVLDKYAKPVYSSGFTEPNFETPHQAMLFEVLEHYESPDQEIDAVFDRNIPVIVLSTGIYNGQDSDWWYLGPEHGQHLFFYSPEAIKIIGNKYNYIVKRKGDLCVFVKPDRRTTLSEYFLWVFLFTPFRKILKAWILLSNGNGAWRDHLELKKNLKKSPRL